MNVPWEQESEEDCKPVSQKVFSVLFYNVGILHAAFLLSGRCVE